MTKQTDMVAERIRLIEAEAARRAKGLARRRELVTGFGAEVALEDALVEMAIFTVGVVTGQQGAARAILEESSREDAQTRRAA